jgi:FAD/FMN-containing dehydrogenase
VFTDLCRTSQWAWVGWTVDNLLQVQIVTANGRVHRASREEHPGGSWWAGMSGAALLCHQRVIGVVTTDPAGFDSRRLVIVPVATVSEDPQFRALITSHVGCALMLDPVELAGLAEPVLAADSPAGLLRAAVADTPFRDRPELGMLGTWCRSSPWSSIRLVVGPAGQGKTRLARELASELGGQALSCLMSVRRDCRCTCGLLTVSVVGFSGPMVASPSILRMSPVSRGHKSKGKANSGL